MRAQQQGRQAHHETLPPPHTENKGVGELHRQTRACGAGALCTCPQLDRVSLRLSQHRLRAPALVLGTRRFPSAM